MSGSFSILLRASRASASSEAMPSGAVTSGMGVITSRTGRAESVSKRMSRFVMMPSSVMSSATTGTPLMWKVAHSASTSARLMSGPMVMGSTTMPASERFTRSTMAAWSSTDRLRWMMPRPPSRAMAMAMADSVTVSMAAEMSGTLRVMRLVTRELVLTSEGITSVSRGMRRTSSKVSAKGAISPVSRSASSLLLAVSRAM